MPQHNLSIHDASALTSRRPTDGQTTAGSKLPIDATWLASCLASANEKLSDRRIALGWTVGILTLGAALRFAWRVHDRFRIVDSEAFFVARAFATKGELGDAYSPIFNVRTRA